MRSLSVEFVEFLLSVGLQELVDQHVTSADPDNEFVVLHLGEDLPLSKDVLAITKPLQRHIEVEVVDVDSHLLINLVALHRLVLQSLLRSRAHFLFLASPSLLFLRQQASLLFSHGLDLFLQLLYSSILSLQILVEVLELGICILKLLLELDDSVISLLDLLVFLLNGRECVLLLHDDVHVDALLLVDVTVPDFDGQLLLGDLLFIVD